MAGHAKYKRVYTELQRLAGRGQTPLDYVCEYLENGGTLVELASELQRLTQWPDPVAQHAIRRCLMRHNDGDEILRRFQEARRIGASAHAENAVQILDEAEEDRLSIERAKARAGVRQWLAEKHDRATYGQSAPQVNVTLNSATLHLSALRQRQVAQVVPPLPLGSGLDERAEDQPDDAPDYATRQVPENRANRDEAQEADSEDAHDEGQHS